jgi:hypothetical protein
LIFNDAVVSSHVLSTYNVKINNTKGQLLASGKAVNAGTKVIVQLDHDISKSGPAVVEMDVERTGDIIKDQTFKFTAFQGVVVK